MSIRLIPFFFWMAVAAVPFFFGLKYHAQTQGFLDRSVETTATITHFQYTDDGLADFVDNDFTPWVSFHYIDGTSSSAPTNLRTGNDTHRIGDEIVIVYDPNYVSPVRAKGFMSLWLFPTVLFTFSGLFAFIGTVHLRRLAS